VYVSAFRIPKLLERVERVQVYYHGFEAEARKKCVCVQTAIFAFKTDFLKTAPKTVDRVNVLLASTPTTTLSDSRDSPYPPSSGAMRRSLVRLVDHVPCVERTQPALPIGDEPERIM